MMDWVDWHADYDNPDSALARRLGVVRMRIAEALDRAPAGPIRVASMCAGVARMIRASQPYRRGVYFFTFVPERQGK